MTCFFADCVSADIEKFRSSFFIDETLKFVSSIGLESLRFMILCPAFVGDKTLEGLNIGVVSVSQSLFYLSLISARRTNDF